MNEFIEPDWATLMPQGCSVMKMDKSGRVFAYFSSGTVVKAMYQWLSNSDERLPVFITTVPIDFQDWETWEYVSDSPTIDQMLSNRGSNYGDFRTQSTIVQKIKVNIREINPYGWNNLTANQAEALDMIVHKIGRIINGNPNYVDSWTDIIGYARLVEKDLIDSQKNSID